MTGDRTQQPAEGSVPEGAAPVGIAHPYPADCADAPPSALLCEKVNRIAAHIPGGGMAQVVMRGRADGAPEIASDLERAIFHAARAKAEPARLLSDRAIMAIGWPDATACPLRPVGRRSGWYVFEERYAKAGHGRAQVCLSDYQIDHGDIARHLDFRSDWLAANFPLPGAGYLRMNIADAAAWLRYQVANAERRREPYRRDEPAQPSPPPAPRKAAPNRWTAEFDQRNQNAGIQRIRGMNALRADKGRTTLAVTFTLPNSAEVLAMKVTLEADQAEALSDVLSGVERAR